MPCALEETVTQPGGYRFGGWGKVELELEHFTLRFAQLEGIFVEKVYTGKTLYGVCDLAKQGYFPAGACYLHSGGLGALISQYSEERLGYDFTIRRKKSMRQISEFPRVELGVLPTPLYKLENLSRETGKNIYIKRDDMIGGALGGNKVR